MALPVPPYDYTPPTPPVPVPAQHFDWQAFILKLKLTVTSRKFWALLSSLAVDYFAWQAKSITDAQAVLGVIAALSVYSGAVALEGGLAAKG